MLENLLYPLSPHQRNHHLAAHACPTSSSTPIFSASVSVDSQRPRQPQHPSQYLLTSTDSSLLHELLDATGLHAHHENLRRECRAALYRQQEQQYERQTQQLQNAYSAIYQSTAHDSSSNGHRKESAGSPNSNHSHASTSRAACARVSSDPQLWSLGEQQCLAIARLLFHHALLQRTNGSRPHHGPVSGVRGGQETRSSGASGAGGVNQAPRRAKVVCFLDEATSAMDEDCESRIYELLCRHLARDSAFVSVGTCPVSI